MNSSDIPVARLPTGDRIPVKAGLLRTRVENRHKPEQSRMEEQ